MSLLNDNSVVKELKISLFILLGDFFLHIPNVVVGYLGNFIQFIQLAYDAVYHLQGTQLENEELYQYSEILKETLIDCYLCIIHGVYHNFT